MTDTSPDHDALDTVLVPRARDMGGFEVRRVLPQRDRQMVGPFIFFDHIGPASFGPEGAVDVRPHPHIGLATVTFLYEGIFRHRDSLGNTQDIRPGAVNWMIAGRGITHSERTPEEMRGKPHSLYGVQTWVALPADKEDMAPDFVHAPASDLPELADGGIKAKVILGRAYGAKVPVPVLSDTLYVDVVLEPGAVLPLPDDHEERAVYVLSGEVEHGGRTLESGQMLIFWEKLPVAVRAGAQGARVMVVGGEVADGPRHIWWNLVSSSKEKIDHAREEWKRGDWGNGQFDLPPDDRDEFIPLD